ncbi:ABC transporter substrate-binding protein [Parachitinimonas caeni]|uniref:ABC transporter substrate-binding protein n=1 Tax=Parachitinimonas caeni TaxID=3031301 RepID=A0ABT7DVW7_9NEIS|nr:ABC transporter substrate-binding protein [Parachitinimonas caeni]MDK2124185.1 ABC transporter substrate-binding protein [Parachitinimonas caeni]
MRNIALRLTTAVIAASFLLTTPAQAAGKVYLGRVGALSSKIKEKVESSNATLTKFFEEINRKGGIHGNQIELVFGDDGFDSNRHVEETKRIIAKHQPIAFIGSSGSGGPQELIKQGILAEARIPLIAPITGAIPLRNDPYIFPIRASWVDELQKLSQQVQALGHQRVAVLYQNDSDGKFGVFAARQEFKKLNMDLVATAAYDRNTMDVAPAVKTLLEAQPTAILLAGVQEALAEFLKQYRLAGGTAQMYTISVVDAQELIQVAGINAARGTGISQVLPFIFADSTPISKEYRAFAKRNKLNIGYTEFEFYIAGKLVAEALRKAGSEPTGEKLIKALESLDNFNVGGYRLSFAPDRHAGSKFVEVTVIGQSGQLVR